MQHYSLYSHKLVEAPGPGLFWHFSGALGRCCITSRRWACQRAGEQALDWLQSSLEVMRTAFPFEQYC